MNILLLWLSRVCPVLTCTFSSCKLHGTYPHPVLVNLVALVIGWAWILALEPHPSFWDYMNSVCTSGLQRCVYIRVSGSLPPCWDLRSQWVHCLYKLPLSVLMKLRSWLYRPAAWAQSAQTESRSWKKRKRGLCRKITVTQMCIVHMLQWINQGRDWVKSLKNKLHIITCCVQWHVHH